MMKSELIMKNNNRKKIIIKKQHKITTTKNKINYLEGKLFKVHGLYFKFIAQRNIPILKYMLVLLHIAVRDSALITIIIDHINFSVPC